ncbi:isochorismatase family protein [Vibrio sp. NH-7]
MLSRDNTGLIIVDVQGKLARLVENSSLFIANCEKLILGVKVLDMPIVLLEQNPEKLGLTVEEVGRHLTHTAAITKSTFNACHSPTFLEAVKAASVDSWLVCGIEATGLEMCLYELAKDCRDPTFKPILGLVR